MSLPSQTAKPYLLLTGATGMLGSQLLAKLMALQVPVAVLTRPKSGRSPESAYQRIDQLLRRFELASQRRLKRPVVLSGDINAPGLGLCADSEAWCRKHIGRVLHSAASLSFLPASESPENEPYRTNVDGGKRLIQSVASWGVSEFHYVSTAYVCGLRTGTVYEDDLNRGQSFSNDYERSKLMAESALHETFAREQLTIYRPSIVIDSSGLSPVSQDRTIYGAYSVFKTLVARLGLPAKGEWFGLLGFDSEHRKNLVEAEWVADRMIQILDNQTLHGRTYHLTSRYGTAVGELEAAFHQAVQSEEKDKSKARSGALVGNAATSASLMMNEQASAILSMLAAPFINIFQPYFRDDPTFSRTQLDEALSFLEIPQEPPVGTAALYQMLSSENEPTRASSGTKSEALESSLADQLRFASFNTAQAIGVITSGAAGVDFAIGLQNADRARRGGLCWGGEACLRRIYLRHDDLQRLASGHVSIADLMSQGRLLAESDLSEQIDDSWLSNLQQTLIDRQDEIGSRLYDPELSAPLSRLRSVQ